MVLCGWPNNLGDGSGVAAVRAAAKAISWLCGGGGRRADTMGCSKAMPFPRCGICLAILMQQQHSRTFGNG